jgi:hypothetical protein
MLYSASLRKRAQAGLAQLVEQLFRKQQVVGSSPTVGSLVKPGRLRDTLGRAEVAERQTRYVQGVVRVTSWEFKSPLRHHSPIINAIHE